MVNMEQAQSPDAPSAVAASEKTPFSEAWWKAVDASNVSLGLADVEELRSVLSNRVFQRAVRQVIQHGTEVTGGTQLLGVDLTTEAGVRKAILIQAHAKAYISVFESLLSLATMNEED
jgi:hypothetical protein